MIFVGLARLDGAPIQWWRAKLGDMEPVDVADLARATATLAALFGGLFAAIYAYRRQRIAEAAGRQADEESFRETGRQITERFSRSAEHIGHDNRAVRVGGLSALERIAKDAPGDRDTVTQLVNAFVGEWRRDSDFDPVVGRVEPDVQVAITVLGRRLLSENEVPLYFYHCGLDQAQSSGNFADAWFYYCRLHSTSFAQANLNDAGFSFCDGEGVAFTKASASVACRK